MPEPLDLTKDVAAALDGALLRGRLVALGYVDEQGDPVVTYRGSTRVFGPDQVAIWVRKADDGFAVAISERPNVHLISFSPDDGDRPRFVSIKGRARVEPSLNDAVYDGTIELEQRRDPDRKGVAVIVDVDSVQGVRSDGPFSMARDGDVIESATS